MIDEILIITDREFLVSILAAVAVFATIITLGLPYLQGDRLASRLKSVASRREELKAKQRETLNPKNQLRPTAKGYMKRTIEGVKLEKILQSDSMREKLQQAGFRGQSPVVTFMFFRLVMPFVMLFAALIYVFPLGAVDGTPTMKVLIAVGVAICGFFLPNLFIQNIITRRQESIGKAFPDALDLLLICVEAGMSIEAAFNRVAREMGQASIELAEELTLTTAELSYLPDRRQAYENLGERTGLPGVKAVSTSLTQAERYGTPLGTALRVMAQENRDMRMAEAEKKAAALPAKLTVPMIIFFLPALFIVILGPAIISYLNSQ